MELSEAMALCLSMTTREASPPLVSTRRPALFFVWAAPFARPIRAAPLLMLDRLLVFSAAVRFWIVFLRRPRRRGIIGVTPNSALPNALLPDDVGWPFEKVRRAPIV